jgi:hypothetical protein
MVVVSVIEITPIALLVMAPHTRPLMARIIEQVAIVRKGGVMGDGC